MIALFSCMLLYMLILKVLPFGPLCWNPDAACPRRGGRETKTVTRSSADRRRFIATKFSTLIMVKVEWFCIVPGCKSNSKAPGHFFPKNPTLSQKWKEIVNNSIIFNTSSEDLRKYRVCHLHFLPEDYIYSVNRRILKHNAVPSLNICNAQTVNTEVNDINTTEQHSQSETSITEIHLEFEANTTDNELHLQSQTSHECNETSTSTTELHLESEANTTDNELHLQSQTSHECNETSTSTTELHLESETNTTDNELHSQSQNSHEFNETSTSNFICAETSALQNDQNNIADKEVNRPSTPSTPSTSRNILGSVTRQCHLTPRAQKLYKKTVKLAKERNRMKRQIIDYKTRLKDAKKFSNTQFYKKFNSLTPTQRLFFDMQLRNTKYAPKVNFKILFNELKSTLKSTCPERSSQYLNNIFFEL
ncbi:uncharacterized protein [Temnothorax longispinosus]|uniref:uncharacterized protein n=1 Tax=Temnothorax longispinosus TaxID=300112 RepID=UPI003A99D9F0